MTSFSLIRSKICVSLVIGGCVLVASQIVGCRDRAKEVTSSSNASSSNAGDQEQHATIDSTLGNLDPLIYELDLPRDMPIRDLNTWASSNLRDMLVPELTDELLTTALSKYADAKFVEQTMRDQFILRDAVHLRDCLWAASLVQSIRQKGDTALQSAVQAFYHVTHEIVLIGKDQTIPLGPFNLMLFGRGLAEDRAWAFGMLANQHRIPVGVFEFANADRPIVAGAVISGQVYLFDLTNGIPIANPTNISDGKGWIETPATLAELLNDEKFFESLSTKEFKYQLTTDDFKSAKFGLVGDSSTWSRRMEGMNNALAGKTDALVAQNFATYGTDEDRVLGDSATVEAAVANLLPKDSVSIWPYPEAQREAREKHSHEQLDRLEVWTLPFSVPHEIQSWVPLKIGPGRFKQQKARASQIVGKTQDAIPIYLAVQRWDELPPLGKDVQTVAPQDIPMAQQQVDPMILAMHMQAAEQAFFWRATSQLQTAKYKSAGITFDSYLRQYVGRPRSKTYIDYLAEASYLAALAEVRIPLEETVSPDELDSHLRRAISLMERVTSGSRFGAAQLWLARWDAMRRSVKPTADQKPNDVNPNDNSRDAAKAN